MNYSFSLELEHLVLAGVQWLPKIYYLICQKTSFSELVHFYHIQLKALKHFLDFSLVYPPNLIMKENIRYLNI